MDVEQITGSLAEIEEQSGIEHKTTVALRLCQACSAETRDRDRFCRRCGVRQTGEISPRQADDDRAAFALRRLRDRKGHRRTTPDPVQEFRRLARGWKKPTDTVTERMTGGVRSSIPDYQDIGDKSSLMRRARQYE